MEQEFFWIWLACAIGFTVAEVSTISFFMLPFALGGLAALIANIFGLSLVGQVLIFLIVSLCALVFVRPFARRVTRKGPANSLGIDRLLNKEGYLTKAITEHEPVGRLHILGEDWLCAADDGKSLFAEGQAVRVVRVEGTKVMIEEVLSK